MSIDGELLFKPGNTNYATLLAAYLGAGKISAACLTGDKAEANVQGPLGRWSITKLTQPQPLDGGLMVQFTLKLFAFTSWTGSEAES